jgi:trans-aconitate methyltransferase
MLEDLDLSRWVLRDGGALNIHRCPPCWEKEAHIQRYEWATRVCIGMHVLDFGCGVGYGTALMANVGNTVLGVDTSRAAIQMARAVFSDCRFELAMGQEINQEWGAVVAFEVLEHMAHPELWLRHVSARHVLVSIPTVPSANPHHQHNLTEEWLFEHLEKRFVVKSSWVQVRPFAPKPSVLIVHGDRV